MKEARFDLKELFFSITEYDSTIISGNDTFVRISGYKRDEIIGQFHNIIRHPDMPHAVFKLFWDYLKADKPVAAYVKNKAKDGTYYWVLAVAFPLNDQFVSIRIKPTTPIFLAVKELYFRLSMAEAKSGMQESERLLGELLNTLGYRDYDHFMGEVLLAELLERKKLLLESATQKEVELSDGETVPSQIQTLYEISQTLSQSYGKWFEKIDSFITTKNTFEEKCLILSSLARDIVLLSLNASVASYKLETDGETFGVLASDIRINAKENDALIEKIDVTSQEISKLLDEIIQLVSYISLQMEMVTYFIQELVHTHESQIDSGVVSLHALVSLYNTQLMQLPSMFEKAIQKNLAYLDELEQQVMYLGYIQIYGIIESARLGDDKLGFGEIFSQLKALIVNTSDEIVSMKKIAESFHRENATLIKESHDIEKMFDTFGQEIATINHNKG